MSTQLRVGVQECLKHESSVHCDELMSLPKSALTLYIGAIDGANIQALERLLALALGLD